MKALIILLFLTIIIYGCSETAKKSDPSGTYVTHFKNEYSLTDDTLIIRNINSTDQAFSIERRSGFQKIRDGVIQIKEFKSSKWDATYNNDSKVLQQTDLGKQVYITDHNSVKLGDSEYKEIK
jgi:hypothetical protein